MVVYIQPVAFWHRFPDGTLKRGDLSLSEGCPVDFRIYTPENLAECPQMVVLCKGIHSHPLPSATKTPYPLLNLLRSILLELGWKLADATPRKIVLDSGFMSALKRALAWDAPFDPALSDLHPSLGNLDHLYRIIVELRNEYFPSGTGFEGMHFHFITLLMSEAE